MPDRYGSLPEVLISNLLPGLAWFATIWMAFALLKGEPYPGVGVPWPSDLSFSLLALLSAIALGYVVDGFRHFLLDGFQEWLADKVRRRGRGDRSCREVGSTGELGHKIDTFRWFRIVQYHPGELLCNFGIAFLFLWPVLVLYLRLTGSWWLVLWAAVWLGVSIPAFIVGSIFIRDFHQNYELLFPDPERPND